MAIYIVKNISTSDKSASINSGVYSFSNGVDTWDMVEYPSAYTFDGSESYYRRITSTEAAQNKDMLFLDYSGLSIHQAGDLMSAYSEENRKVLVSFCYREFGGQLRKNSWTPIQQKLFKNQVDPIFAAALTGDVRHVKDAIEDISPVAPLTQAMLDSINAMCDEFLEVFPDGK